MIGKDTCFYKVASGGRGSGSALSATSMYFRERPSWTTSMEQHTDDGVKTHLSGFLTAWCEAEVVSAIDKGTPALIVLESRCSSTEHTIDT